MCAIILSMSDIESLCHAGELQKHSLESVRKMGSNKLTQMIKHINGPKLDKIDKILKIHNEFKLKCMEVNPQFYSPRLFDVIDRDTIFVERAEIIEKHAKELEQYKDTIAEQNSAIMSLRSQLNMKSLRVLDVEATMKTNKKEHYALRRECIDLKAEQDNIHGFLDSIVKKRKRDKD